MVYRSNFELKHLKNETGLMVHGSLEFALIKSKLFTTFQKYK